MTVSPDLIACRKCGTPKMPDAFARDRSRRTGRHPYCKACTSAYHRLRYGSDPALRQRKLEAALAWRASLSLEDRRFKFRLDESRRRARKLGADVAEVREWSTALSRDPCAYCGAPGEHDDHIVPLARGGAHDWSNLTRSCGACNTRKAATSLLEFLMRA